MANIENIRKWVAALRSGGYEQGKNSLRSGDGKLFCCLGVACDIYDGSQWAPNRWDEPVYMGEAAGLPPTVVDWLGLDSPDPYLDMPVTSGVIKHRASVANDTLNWTFAEIADALERTYLRGE